MASTRARIWFDTRKRLHGGSIISATALAMKHKPSFCGTQFSIGQPVLGLTRGVSQRRGGFSLGDRAQPKFFGLIAISRFRNRPRVVLVPLSIIICRCASSSPIRYTN
jgi:hypothetical protein